MRDARMTAAALWTRAWPARLIAIGATQLPQRSSDGKDTTRLTAAQTQRAARRLARRRWPRCMLRQACCSKAARRRLHARLAALKGYPVVINKWASWCVPCKEEFGAFQRVSAEYGRRVAFIGIDSEDPQPRRRALLPEVLSRELPQLLRPERLARAAADRLDLQAHDRVHTRPRPKPTSARASTRVRRSCAATSNGTRCMPEIRVDPLSGHKVIVAGERSARPGGEPRCPAPAPIDVEKDPFAAGTRI